MTWTPFKGSATAKAELENKRKAGKAVTGWDMGRAEQDALHSLLSESRSPKSAAEMAEEKEERRRKVLGGKKF